MKNKYGDYIKFAFFIGIVLLVFLHFKDKLSYEPIVIGTVMNLICIIYLFKHPKIAGTTGFILNISGGIACATFYATSNNLVYLVTSSFLTANSIIFIVLTYLSLENIKKERALLRLNQYDSLTNIFNHRHFQNIIGDIFESCRARKDNLSLLMLDIDNFKMLNDYFGHITGDAILSDIANIIKSSIRDNDYVFRYGGDEFLVLLPKSTIEEARQISIRILKNVNKYENSMILKNLKNYKVSISIGISNYPILCDNHKSLIHQADMALYDSKYSGRNSYTIYQNVFSSAFLNSKKSSSDFNKYVKSLLSMIDAKDNYTYGHSIRVSKYAYYLGQKLNMNETDLEKLRIGGLLHDIGKIKISEKILNKDSKLTSYEYNLIKLHPLDSTETVNSIISDKSILSAIMHHHERFDGMGYPDKLKGNEIPLFARILAIADSFDAMRSTRIYSPSKSTDETLDEIGQNSGTQFDPQLSKAFISMIKSKFPEEELHNNFNYEEYNQGYKIKKIT